METGITTCPTCGAAVHALAGRCKCCKADLVSARAKASIAAARPATTPSIPNDSPRKQRWPLIVAMFSLLVIGTSVGILIERSLNPESTSTTPPPATRAPRTTAPENKPNMEQFAAMLSTALCKKLLECTVDDEKADPLCKRLESEVGLMFSASRVHKGECRYDADSAQRCTRSIEDIQCETRKTESALDWLVAASSRSDCANTYICTRPSH